MLFIQASEIANFGSQRSDLSFAGYAVAELAGLGLRVVYDPKYWRFMKINALYRPCLPPPLFQENGRPPPHH